MSCRVGLGNALRPSAPQTNACKPLPQAAMPGRRARALPALLLALALLLLAPRRGSGAVQLDGGAPGGDSRGAAAAAAAAAAATAAPAAPHTVAGRFGDYPTLWQYYEALFPASRMIPTIRQMRGRRGEHEVLWQVPPSPRGTLFIAHGCSHAAHDWWPASPACPYCLGLPEEMAQTQQALARGYAGGAGHAYVRQGMCGVAGRRWCSVRSRELDAPQLPGDANQLHLALLQCWPCRPTTAGATTAWIGCPTTRTQWTSFARS